MKQLIIRLSITPLASLLLVMAAAIAVVLPGLVQQAIAQDTDRRGEFPDGRRGGGTYYAEPTVQDCLDVAAQQP
ncbi:MAG: hypothetical protein KME20_00560 [Kaiparowitsia implicata GSE-PSE-MK54-09C]|jgi:hypothetical protein|nr:hypothetical protein [Kaiparowitsia implicata GSE-PSE-MK54-09C]